MSNEKRPRPDELVALARTYDTMARLIEDNTELKVRAESFERQSAILDSDNESLRQQIKRSKVERDHYFRAYTALTAQLDGVASSLINAIKSTQTQIYGGRRPVPDLETAKESIEPVPSVVKKGPQREERQPVAINLRTLAESISGRGHNGQDLA